jgi:FdhD protein
VAEEPLEIVVNGSRVATLMRLPGDERELAVGFCFTEGLVADFGSILLVAHCGTAPLSSPTGSAPLESRNRVHVTASPGAVRSRSDWSRLIRAGCGGIDPEEVLQGDWQPVASSLQVGRNVLLALNRSLLKQPRIYRRTGGVHAAALYDAQGSLLVVREDIGRHNAVDKVIGYALLRSIPLADKLILTTGRASHEMVTKAARAGVPILASVSAPTSLAVELGQRLNLTLVGYVRGPYATVYTHPWRVAGVTPG